MPKTITVPLDIDQATDRLIDLDGISTATGYERAAIVWAFTHDAKRGGQPNVEISTFTEAAFSRLGIVGLTTRDSVRYYREAWRTAIERGEATDLQPGDKVVLPTSKFPPQEANQGSRVSSDPAKAMQQVIAKHGVEAIASTPEAVEIASAALAEPSTATIVMGDKQTRTNARTASNTVLTDKVRAGTRERSKAVKKAKPTVTLLELDEMMTKADSYVEALINRIAQDGLEDDGIKVVELWLDESMRPRLDRIENMVAVLRDTESSTLSEEDLRRLATDG